MLEASNSWIQTSTWKPLFQILDFLAIKAHKKNLELVVSLGETVPRKVSGDPNRLRQVIINLIGNAIKFTDSGEIMLEVTYPAHGQVQFLISDSGIGIPGDKLRSIFESFTQLDTTSGRLYEGSGLGLAISRSLVERMGGAIWADSTQGEGSTFGFCLPLSVREEAGLPLLLPALADTKVLLAVANGKSRRNITQVLKASGAQVHAVADGLQAYLEYDQGIYDLLILDSSMPGMDGFALAGAIVSKDEGAARLLMLIRSDRAHEEIAHCNRLGISHYLVKPIYWPELSRSLALMLKPSSQAAIAAATAAASPRKGLKILLVEDSPDNQVLIQAFLRPEGHLVIIAENGCQAVEYYIADQTIDLVLMDIQLPKLDGLQATKQIREYEQSKDLLPKPIIALTAYAFAEDVQKSLAAGCNGHLSKPLKKTTLLQALEQYRI